MKPVDLSIDGNALLLQSFGVVFKMFPSWMIAILLLGILHRVGLLKPLLRFLRDQITQHPTAAVDINAVDSMDGRAFEAFLKGLFERQGYEVHLTPYQGDWGGDLVISRNKIKTVVQAKRYTSRCVGVDSVQQVVAAKAVYGCTDALVVTSSQFTQAARQLARANEVRLWDRDDLAAQMRSTPQREGEAVAYAASSTPDASFLGTRPLVPCARCGKLVSRRVEEYCRSQPVRFRGQVYCFEHQREIGPFQAEPRH